MLVTEVRTEIVVTSSRRQSRVPGVKLSEAEGQWGQYEAFEIRRMRHRLDYSTDSVSASFDYLKESIKEGMARWGSS